MALVATDKPGEFIIPEAGRTIRLIEWEEKDIYDTQTIAGGQQLQGGTVNFYTNQAGKTFQDSNVRTDGKLPARHELICFKVGLFLKPSWGTSIPSLRDQIAIYSEGVFTLDKSAKPQVTATHMWRLATGYGYVAYGVFANGAGAGAGQANVTPGNLGVASPAAIPPLLVPFSIQPDDDFEAVVDFPTSQAGVAMNAAAPVYTSQTLDDEVAMMVALHGFVKSPGTK